MIKIGPALLDYAEQLERERGITKDVTLDSLKEAMLAAYRKYAKLPTSEGLECKLLEKSGEIGIYQVRTVVPTINDIEDGAIQIALKDAQKIRTDAEVGEVVENEVTPEDFGRIAAQSAKQVITQRIREAEKLMVLKEFEEKRGQVTTGIIQRIEGRNAVVNIGKCEAILPPREQLPGEYYRVGNKVRVFVSDIRQSGRVPQIVVSQSHPAMVREVFELEVPEIEDGIIEIKSIAREAGFRTKVAVVSYDPDVDAQGACIGTRGSRIQAIINELKNEKIDIIQWSNDPRAFIVNALQPARKIANVKLEDMGRFIRALVVVPDDQLSLAIGREGQNVRLAAKLTGCKLDIKPLSQATDEDLAPDPADHIPTMPVDEPPPAPAAEGEEGEAEEGKTAEAAEGEETTEGVEATEAAEGEADAAEDAEEEVAEAEEVEEADDDDDSEEEVAEAEEADDDDDSEEEVAEAEEADDDDDDEEEVAEAEEAEEEEEKVTS